MMPVEPSLENTGLEIFIHEMPSLAVCAHAGRLHARSDPPSSNFPLEGDVTLRAPGRSRSLEPRLKQWGLLDRQLHC
jgi:hypothetical protein